MRHNVRYFYFSFATAPGFVDSQSQLSLKWAPETAVKWFDLVLFIPEIVTFQSFQV